MRETIDTQRQRDPGALSVTDEWGTCITCVCCWRARPRFKPGNAGRGRAHADLARKAEVRDLDAWGQFKVLSPVRLGARTKALAETRWVLTWKEVDGKKTVKARLDAKGFLNPNLRDGNLDIAGCGSGRSSHLRLASLGALEAWEI